MNISDMANAHLETVRGAVRDLFAQKEKIDQEITRLSQYIQQGESVVTDFSHVNDEVSESSSVDPK